MAPIVIARMMGGTYCNCIAIIEDGGWHLLQLINQGIEDDGWHLLWEVGGWGWIIGVVFASLAMLAKALRSPWAID